ncbi:MAG: translation initiation factor IF-2 [Bacteroidaceae bacterium]
MSIRLNKVTKECNVGLQTVVEVLQKKGFEGIEANPNTKITEEQYEILLKEFNRDKGLRTEAAQLIRQRQEQSRGKRDSSRSRRAERARSEKAEVIETPKVEGPKVVGRIDLNAPKPVIENLTPTPKEQTVQKTVEENTHKTAKVEPEKVVATEMPAAGNDNAKAEKKPSTPRKEKPAIGTEVDGVFRLNIDPQVAPGLTVKGHIDLSAINQSTRPKKKSKEEKRREREEKNRNGNQTGGQQGGGQKKRQRIGKERVDVNAVASQMQNNGGGGQKNRQSSNGNNQGNGGKNKQKHKNQPKQAVQPAEVSDEEVAKQVRETLARLTNKSNKMGKGAKYRREKREAIRAGMEEEIQAEAAESKVLKLTEFVTANELATMMNVPVTQVIATCMSVGIMVSINQRMDAETINLIADEFGFQTEYVSAEVSAAVNEVEDDEEDLQPRAPIVTVMGHVDHGKTSLLDYIRQTNVIAGEAGGITQHIGAYNVSLPDGRHVTFLDTPGHEAFTAMRARGAQVTDIAIIIVAADDDIMPQTKEAINHAVAANVPIVFAINKIDKPTANPEKIKEGLAQMNFLVEDWGGKYQSQDISAKKGIGVDELLEKVLLEAEMLDLKANPNRKATGTIIESSLDKGRGYVATVLVSNGTLHVGDIMLAGTNYGRVKAMLDERGHRITEIGPSQAATILGLNGAPQAGDSFHVMDTDQEAREIAGKREQLAREQGLRTMKRVDLNEIGRRIALGDFQELNLIVKGDVDGSIEALSDSLIKLSTEKIQVNVIQKAVGQISENDVNLAAASDAIIVAFQVRPSASARKLAEQEGVDIRTYSVIYDAIEEVKDAMEGMLSPEIKEEVTAQVEVRQVYHISKVGTVAGAYVIDGKVHRSDKARVVRDGIVVFTGEINALKRFKDDVKEVSTNFECGLSLVNYNDLREGDIIETFAEIEVKAKL